MSSNIKLVIKAQSKDLGDDFFVRRSLPFRKQRMVGPFIFWDHMGPATISPERPMVVRAHPHIGLSTITYLFTGEILHRDNLGNELKIKPGEVNWMTAGKGIAHSERCEPGEPMELEGIQLWVALPTEAEDTEPSFVHFKENDLPMVEKGGCRLRLIAGKAFGQSSPLPVFSNLFYLNGQGRKGSSFNMPLKTNQEGALYIVRGSLEVENKEYPPQSMLIFKENTSIDFKAHEDVEFMVLGGDIFPETRSIWWNFVSSDIQKIEEAKKAWEQNKMAPVINETEKIPLPTS